jgi:hypothetical protein
MTALLVTCGYELQPMRLGLSTLRHHDVLRRRSELTGGLHIEYRVSTSNLMQFWFAGDGAEQADPQLNMGAMWIIQQLCGARAVPVIFGDMVIAGRTYEGAPRALNAGDIAALRSIVLAQPATTPSAATG